MTDHDDDRERRKQAIFDGMGKRGQKRILQQGYAVWDPFEEPKDPLDIRKDISKRTVNQLVHEFLQTRREETSSVAFAEGVMEMALALMNNNDKYRGMFAYALWYAELLKKEGHDDTP